MTFEVKIEVIFGLSGTDNLQVSILDRGCRCNLIFKGCKAVALTASKAKTEARFGLSGPDNPQESILKAVGTI